MHIDVFVYLEIVIEMETQRDAYCDRKHTYVLMFLEIVMEMETQRDMLTYWYKYSWRLC